MGKDSEPSKRFFIHKFKARQYKWACSLYVKNKLTQFFSKIARGEEQVAGAWTPIRGRMIYKGKGAEQCRQLPTSKHREHRGEGDAHHPKEKTRRLLQGGR